MILAAFLIESWQFATVCVVALGLGGFCGWWLGRDADGW
jgi:membrane protein YqaA with SNARE-associated domain